MAHYMLQLAYTSAAWNAMVEKPQNRLEAVQPVIESLGGRVESAWLTFGEYDVMLVFELPDNVSAAAFAAVIAAGGAARAIQTTPLMTIEDAMAAMQKANGIRSYRPPAA